MKRKLLFVYVFIAFVLVCNSVYATITMDMSLEADKTTVKPGEELAVTVKLKNISAPISSIESGFINIDEDIVGSFSEDMIAKNSNGKIEVKAGGTTNELSYIVNPTAPNADYDVIFNTKNTEALEGNDCRFVMDLKQDIQGDAEILGFNLKVKDTATIKDVKDAIKVEIKEAYSNTDTVKPVAATLDVKVEKATPDPEPETNTNENKADENTNTNQNVNNTNTNTNTNNNTNTNTNKNTNTNNNTNKNTNNTNTNTNKNTNTNNNTNNNKAVNNTNTDGTVSATKLPAAGAGMLFIPVIICALVGYISYIKYLKYKDI